MTCIKTVQCIWAWIYYEISDGTSDIIMYNKLKHNASTQISDDLLMWLAYMWHIVKKSQFPKRPIGKLIPGIGDILTLLLPVGKIRNKPVSECNFLGS